MATMYFCSYSLVLFGVILIGNEVYAQVTPTDSNSTTEWYSVTNNDGLSAPLFQCGLANCYIDCFGTSACVDASIDASSSQNLVLNCGGGTNACSGVYIYGAPTVNADINCVWSGGKACYQSNFDLITTNNVHLECSGYTGSTSSSGNCYDVTLTATQADTVTIVCDGDYDCYSMQINVESVTESTIINGNGEHSLSYTVIQAASSAKLELYCNNVDSCEYVDVYPPYQDTAYAFKMYCIPLAYSCQDVDVIIARATYAAANYMELVCPKSNVIDSCDIRWTCQDVSSSYVTATSFDSTNARFVCNDDDCCPWTSDDDMVQSTTMTLPLPNSISPTSSNDTSEAYILDTEVSDRLISCSKENCYIECQIVGSCLNARIYAGDSSYLSILCEGNDACQGLYVTEGPSIEADIRCTSVYADTCINSVFDMENTQIVNLECDTNGAATSTTRGACSNAVLFADNAINVTVDCATDWDCYSADVYAENAEYVVITADGDESFAYGVVRASNANRLELYCNGGESCEYVDAYPPYDDAYKFKLFCNSKAYSCYYFDVKIPSSSAFADNYMEMICPESNEFTYACDIDWYCLDVSTSALTSTSYSYGFYVCGDQDCCPWSSNEFKDIIISPRTILANSIEPYLNDLTGEYYTLDVSTYSNPISISCTNPAGCYIECTVADSCYYASIYAGDTDNLFLTCTNAEACRQLYITAGPQIKAEIDCSSQFGSACYGSHFILTNTKTVDITCDGSGYSSASTTNGACGNLFMRAESVETLNIDCLGKYDCYSADWVFGIESDVTITGLGEYALDEATIYAQDADRLNITCAAYRACDSMDIYPPSSSTYDFYLSCSDDDYVCYYLEIYFPSTYATNFMSLECAGTSTYQCDIDFNCGGYDNSMLYESSYERWQCDSHERSSSYYSPADDYCCPWEDVDYMLAPRECVVVDGKFCGSDLFNKGFNIFSLESSGSAILNDEYLAENTELWSDEGASCSLSSLEFGSSFTSYSDYAESDSTSIGASYGTDAGGAGGSLSQSRSSIKNFAASAQSYIYTLDVDCQTATVSTVAYNKLYFNTNFLDTLRLLPTSYSSSNLDDFTDFWNTYGTHFLSTANLGGSIRGAMASNKCGVLEEYGESESFELCLNAEYKGAEVDGCYSESESYIESTSVESFVGITQIEVKGGKTSTFTSVFNQFGSKTNDFQDWINDLAVFPDVIGGNLVEIHSMIKQALTLGNHRLNDGLTVTVEDSTWLSIAEAMEDAYDAYKSQLETEDVDIGNCAITCYEGTVDVTTCECSACNDISGCCGLTEVDGAYTMRVHYVIYVWLFGFVASILLS